MRNKVKKIISISTMIIFLLLSLNKLMLSNEYLEHLNFREAFKSAQTSQNDGNFDEALVVYKDCLKMAIKIVDREKEAKVLLKLGLIFWNKGDLISSYNKYKDALIIGQKYNFKNILIKAESALEIQDLYNGAKKYRNEGDIQKSSDNFVRAIEISKDIDSKELELKCLRQFSINYWITNDLLRFNELNKKALNLAESLNHKREIGNCLNNIGLSFWKMNSLDEALDYYGRALDIAKSQKNSSSEAEYLNNIGLIFRKIGNYDKSLENLLLAYKIDKKISNEQNIAIDLNNIGNVYWYKGLLSTDKEDIKSALNYYELALKLLKNRNIKQVENIELKILNNIGSIYNSQKNFPKALYYFNQAYNKAKKIKDKETMSMALNNLGIVNFNLGNYEKSTEYYEKAIILASKIEGGHILWEAYLRKANAYKKQHEIAQAIYNYKKSISVIENIRSQIKLEEYKSRFLGTDIRLEAYQNLIDLLVKESIKNQNEEYKNEAFLFSERAKARSFLDSFELSQINISEHVNFILRNKEKEITKNISNLYTKLLDSEISSEAGKKLHDKLEKYESELESLRRKIRLENPIYANLKYPEIITLSETQKNLLDNKTAIFSYLIGKDNSYALVVTKENLKIFKLTQKETIRELEIGYLKSISDKDNTNFEIGQQLFNMLIKPGISKKIKNIIIIPDDILYYLPFEALINKGNWLIEDYNISYANSVSSYREIVKRHELASKKQKFDFLAFGNPTSDRMNNGNKNKMLLSRIFSLENFDLSPLKYSKIEIEKISSLFPTKKEKIFLSSDAKEENIKKLDLTNYKIIHFATHSLIDDKNPDRSTILLSFDDNPAEDGFLQVREIFNLRLNADLVTLSSCQTGLGQLIRGEGIEGLNRAFFYAGSSSVLMSLWSVNDQATYQLMERFYKYLLSSNCIGQALRYAKLELIKSKNLSHPYYWAGFVVYGDAEQKIFSNGHQNYFVLVFALFLTFISVYLIRKAYIHKNKSN